MRSFFVLIIFILLSPNIWAQEISFCPQSLALRKGQDHCWAMWWEDGKTQVCFSRKIYNEILHSQYDSFCGVFSGKWKSWAPPFNQKTAARTEKEFFRTFRVERIRQSQSPPRWQEQVESLRERISRAIRDQTGVLRRLVLNEKTPGSLEKEYRTVGFVHLVSETGIHLYALAFFLEKVVFYLVRTFGGSVSKGIWLSRILALISWISIWLLAGLRVGMLRPFVIVFLRYLATSVGFRWSLWAPLSISLLLDGALAVYSWASGGPTWAPGRLHYALAVGGGLMAIEYLWSKSSKNFSSFQFHVALSVGSWLPTALLDLFETRLVALATPLLSLISIPVYASVILPATLLAIVFELFFGISTPLQWVAQGSDFFLEVLFPLTCRSGLLWVVGGGMLIFAIPLGFFAAWNRRICWVLVLLSLVVLPFRDVFEEEDRGIMLDVGQGDAFLFRIDGRWGLVDAGSPYSSYDFWLRIFAHEGVDRLDWILLSHFDSDHAGGVELIAPLIRTGVVLASSHQWRSSRGRRTQNLLHQLEVPSASIDQSPQLVPFSVLTFDPKKGTAKPNEMMNVAFIPLMEGQVQVLMTGDVSFDREGDILSWLETQRQGHSSYTILKLAHHGSRYSSSKKFLKQLSPDEVWVSAGYGNHFGHPSVEALARVRTMLRLAPIRRTDLEGKVETNAH